MPTLDDLLDQVDSAYDDIVLGVETYGFTGAHPDDHPLEDRVHGTDEYIGIRSLVSGTKIMLALAYDVLAAT